MTKFTHTHWRRIRTLATIPLLWLSAPAATKTELMNLPRLISHGHATEVSPVKRSKVTVADLSVQNSGKTSPEAPTTIPYLVVEAGKSWTQALRPYSTEPTFVSFLAYAPYGTVIDIGGAKLSIVPSNRANVCEILIGSATFGAQRKFGDIRAERHGNGFRAALPVLTVRLDPAAGTWDLFVFGRLVAEDVPISSMQEGQFRLSASGGDAWLLGWVNADENPLFVDANANGVEDAFEVAQLGALLPSKALPSARAELVRAWKEHQRVKGATPWSVQLP